MGQEINLELKQHITFYYQDTKGNRNYDASTEAKMRTLVTERDDLRKSSTINTDKLWGYRNQLNNCQEEIKKLTGKSYEQTLIKIDFYENEIEKLVNILKDKSAEARLIEIQRELIRLDKDDKNTQTQSFSKK